MWTRGNPFTPSSGFVKLHNLFTEGSVCDMAGERLPHFSENNKLRYEFFWQECFIDKTKSLSSILLFLIIGHCQPHRKNKSQRRSKLSKKCCSSSKFYGYTKFKPDNNIRNLLILHPYGLLDTLPIFNRDFSRKPLKDIL